MVIGQVNHCMRHQTGCSVLAYIGAARAGTTSKEASAVAMAPLLMMRPLAASQAEDGAAPPLLRRSAAAVMLPVSLPGPLVIPLWRLVTGRRCPGRRGGRVTGRGRGHG